MNGSRRSSKAPAAKACETGTPFESVALLLQGGGALGSYQAGVIEGLAASGIAIDWVAGISIGAVNAALVAGNPPERRVDALQVLFCQSRVIPPHCHDAILEFRPFFR